MFSTPPLPLVVEWMVRMYGTARATQWSYSLFSMQVLNS